MGYADYSRRPSDYDDEPQWKRRRLSPPSDTPSQTLRLLAVPSSRSPLPPEQTLALCDAASTTAIGRDRAFDTRIRLKELAVSKTHATLFWLPENGDGQAASWAITDCGSQHGTFLQRADSKDWQRISEPRTASTPHRFGHLDRIKICSTTFVAHVHQPPCDACAIVSDGSNLIPLTAEPEAAAKESVAAPSLQSSSRADRHDSMKRDLKDLKAQLLAKPDRPGKEVPDAPKIEYVDRAKMRRQQYGTSVGPDHNVKPIPRPAPVSQPFSRPIEESKGYALLSKLSGPLGAGSSMAAPVEAKTLGDSKAGLGSRAAMGAQDYAADKASNGSSYESRRRRWDEFRK